MASCGEVETASRQQWVEAALEETCQALFTLLLLAAESESIELTRAMAALREAVRQLRQHQGNHQSPLGYGFVVGDSGAKPVDKAVQSSP